MCLQLTQNGTVVTGSDRDLERLRQEFAERHCILLRQFLEPSLARSVYRALDDGEFEDRQNLVKKELCLKPGRATAMLWFMANDPHLFDLIQQITGVPQLSAFVGRVYRMTSGAGHHRVWHNDLVGDRAVAMSLNLSTSVFRGGHFQIREEASGRMIHDVANVGMGDALLFRVARSLSHRNTDLEGEVVKTALAGWFLSRPPAGESPAWPRLS